MKQNLTKVRNEIKNILNRGNYWAVYADYKNKEIFVREFNNASMINDTDNLLLLSSCLPLWIPTAETLKEQYIKLNQNN